MEKHFGKVSAESKQVVVKCDVCLSPASPRGRRRPSLSPETARRILTSWPSSRPDRTSCRRSVSAPPSRAAGHPPARQRRGEGRRRKQEASCVALKPRAWPLCPPGGSPQSSLRNPKPSCSPQLGKASCPLPGGQLPLFPVPRASCPWLRPRQIEGAERGFGDLWNPSRGLPPSSQSVALASELSM